MRHCLSEALRALLRRPATTFFAVTSIALSLFLAGVIWLTGRGLDRLSRGWAKGAVVAVYLEDTIKPSEQSRIQRSLEALPGFHELKKITQKAALIRLKKNLGGDGSVLKGVKAAWLPSSFEVTLKGKRETLLQAQKRLVAMGKGFSAITEVRTLHQWHRRLDRLAKTLNTASAVLMALTLVVCGFVVTSTVRLGLLTRREELETQRLLGATKRFVAAPVLMEGAIQSLLGSLLALLFLYGLYSFTIPKLSQILGVGWDSGTVEFVSLSTVAWAIFATTAVGVFGSRLAVGRGETDG